MKVSEAKTKVCPFIGDMAFVNGEVSSCGTKGIPININCICGDCMAWVETEGTDYTKEMLEWVERDRVQKIGKTAHELNEWYAENPAPDNQTEEEGYCKRLGK